MTWYTYESQIALDPSTEQIARNAAGQVYALSDTAFATPLAVTDLAGITRTELIANTLGLIEQFRVEDHKVVVWKSGDYAIVLSSIQGLVDDAEAAAAAAELAKNAAENAAQAASTAALPPGAAPGLWLSGGNDGTPVWVPLPTSGGGGSVLWGSIPDKPLTFPPDLHGHSLAQINDMTGLGRNVAKATDANALRALAEAAPASNVSFPGFGTTADKAAQGNHGHTAGAVQFTPVGPITATNVQEAIAQAAATGGTGGSGTQAILVYTYRSGAYPALPAAKPTGAERVVFQGPVQPTTVPSWVGVGPTQVPSFYEYVATS